MKNIALSTLMTFALGLVLVSNTQAERCERLSTHDALDNIESIEQDLTSSSWESDIFAHDAQLLFYDNGLVISIKESKDGDHARFGTWELNMSGGQPCLTIEANDGRCWHMRLSATCDGYASRGCINAADALVKEQLVKSTLLKQRSERQMIGQWDMASADGRNVSWNFSKDGSFTLQLSPDSYHNTFQGIWDLTDDGEHIILYFTRDANPESVYLIELLSMRSLDYEDLVLEANTLPFFLSEFKGNDLLFFEKDYGS